MNILIYKNDQQEGPYDYDTIIAGLSAGRFVADDFAFVDGCKDWVPLHTLITNIDPRALLHEATIANKPNAKNETNNTIQSDADGLKPHEDGQCPGVAGKIFNNVKCLFTSEDEGESEEDECIEAHKKLFGAAEASRINTEVDAEVNMLINDGFPESVDDLDAKIHSLYNYLYVDIWQPFSDDESDVLTKAKNRLIEAKFRRFKLLYSMAKNHVDVIGRSHCRSYARMVFRIRCKRFWGMYHKSPSFGLSIVFIFFVVLLVVLVYR